MAGPRARRPMTRLLKRIVVTAIAVVGVAVLRSRLLDADDARTGFGRDG